MGRRARSHELAAPGPRLWGPEGAKIHTQATHVDALSDMFSDAGSTPAASTNAIQLNRPPDSPVRRAVQ
ncbi:protein of unknown function [Candidatus Methylomirabilis oxygeniifera]|uniref:Uncharacterized protein n=1 Tax=Methylomirabilis oxygeniifera TaxID=671143 RepID=D5MJP8_METO1|nr:protein of unknown function [Candidatus Methylomirabilis oxyfera]